MIGTPARRPATAAGADGLLIEVVESEAFRLGCLLLPQRSPGNRTNARDDLLDTKRFDDEVVCAQFQTKHFVDLVRFCSYKNDGNFGTDGAHPSADVVSVHLGHHDVQADKIRQLALE